MTRPERYGRFHLFRLNTLSEYPVQHIHESIEADQPHIHQLSVNISMDGAVQRYRTTTPQTKQILEITDDGWPTAATVIRRDGFSRSRNEGDEDILMDDDEAEDGDDEESIMTQVRVGQHSVMRR